MKKIIYDLKNIDEILKIILDTFSSKIVCLNGDLGSGKTTLVAGMLAQLGALEKGNSPTFSLVNEYRNAKNELVAYHFDCYRLDSAEEALDIGLEEYLAADCWVFIEWPERIAELLPLPRTEIHIRVIDEETRELTIHNLPK